MRLEPFLVCHEIVEKALLDEFIICTPTKSPRASKETRSEELA